MAGNKVTELLALASANPDLPIVFMVDGEETCDPMEYRYTLQAIQSVEVERLATFNERVFIGLEEIKCELRSAKRLAARQEGAAA